MTQKEVCLVVPSIRENCYRDFVERWANLGLFDHVDLMLMEDNPEKTIDGAPATFHYSWQDIDKEMGDDNWIIPRRSDTVRSFGYLKAYEFGYPFIMTLDDDCYPDPELDYDGGGFVADHMKWLTKRSKWYNTLNSVKPRGIPFYNLGQNRNVIVNHGLWTNVLDYDAPYQLANPIPEEFSYDNKIVPSGLFFPMCGMNVMWKREATVLMYHMLMGQMPSRGRRHESGIVDYRFINSNGVVQPMLEKLAFDRFGDIWCGIFMKKIADMTTHQVSTGMPYIRHERASNPFANLKKEANGIEVNEKLWQYVDSFHGTGSHAQHFPRLYSELGEYIGRYDEFKEHVQYFKLLGEAMQKWAAKFGG